MFELDCPVYSEKLNCAEGAVFAVPEAGFLLDEQVGKGENGIGKPPARLRRFAGGESKRLGEREIGAGDGLSVLVDASEGMNLQCAVVTVRVVFDLRLGDVSQAKASKIGVLSLAMIASISAASCGVA